MAASSGGARGRRLKFLATAVIAIRRVDAWWGDSDAAWVFGMGTPKTRYGQ